MRDLREILQDANLYPDRVTLLEIVFVVFPVCYFIVKTLV